MRVGAAAGVLPATRKAPLLYQADASAAAASRRLRQ